MRDFDFSPLFRSAIGFERLPSLLDAAMRAGDSFESYPPYNIEATGDNAYRISLAVAGFSPDEIEVEARDNMLIVKGRSREEDGEVRYLHHGIARRSFERRFQLAEYVEVTGASLVDGLLSIDLARELPETMKPRKIAISAPATGKVIEHEKAA